MRQLVRQRIKFLVEYGGIYPHDEPASKNFVVKAVVIIAALQLLEMYVHLMLHR